MGADVLTLPQASKICAVSRWTLRDFVTSGQLKAFKTPGGHYRIYKSDLESFIRERNAFSVTKKVPQKKRILIVDDDSKIRKLLGRILEDNGYDIEFAVDGFDAGLKLMQFQPHLVILDLIMPQIDGFEVCRRIKEDDGISPAKVIAVSGFDTEENRSRIYRSGADLFLPKPLNVDIVRKEVKNLFNE